MIKTTSKPIISEKFTSTQSAVINTLLYFDIFNYPLTEDEIFYFHKIDTRKALLSETLKTLLEWKIIYLNANFYALHENESMIKKRLEANFRAEKKMELARKFSSLMARIPFVQAIMLSGSISKGAMHPDSDIDYFVVAKTGKVWIVKFLIVLYRKVFLLNDRKHFCANYIIDENHLEIEEKNRFTATEIVTLIPTYGYDVYLQLMNLNGWAKDYFPNHPLRTEKEIIEPLKKTWGTKVMANIFAGRFGRWFSNKFMNYSWNRYQRKFKDRLEAECMKIAFKSTPNVSKSHGPNFQKVVNDRFERKVCDFELEHNINRGQIIF